MLRCALHDLPSGGRRTVLPFPTTDAAAADA